MDKTKLQHLGIYIWVIKLFLKSIKVSMMVTFGRRKRIWMKGVSGEGREESESCSVMSNSLQPHGLDSAWNSPGQNTGMGNHSLLQGIFSTQGSNPGLPHYRQILYQLSHKGSPLSITKELYKKGLNDAGNHNGGSHRAEIL